MPKVMLRMTKRDTMSFYVAKQDLEAEVKRLQFNEPGKWGGEVELEDGSLYFIEPLDTPPTLPVTVRANRLRED